MSDFLKAYEERLQRNHKAILKLAKDVIAIDKSVEAYLSIGLKSYISSITFFKDESINTIAFHEVPYRWSGCGYTEHGKSHSGDKNCSLPFTPMVVLASFKPITSILFKQPNEYFTSKDQYLKWYFFLKKYDDGISK